MARFNASNADQYGGSEGGFFGLKNDKDKAIVRLGYNCLEDVEGVTVHELEVEGSKKYVECLREPGDPVSVCPFCEERIKLAAKIFIRLWNIEKNCWQVWERGKTFYNKLSGLASRYNPLCGVELEIERNGKAGDTNTSYEIYPAAPDGMTLEELEEFPEELIENRVLIKTVDEMLAYLESGSFEDSGVKPRTQTAANPRTQNNTRQAAQTTRAQSQARPRRF